MIFYFMQYPARGPINTLCLGSTSRMKNSAWRLKQFNACKLTKISMEVPYKILK